MLRLVILLALFWLLGYALRRLLRATVRVRTGYQDQPGGAGFRDGDGGYGHTSSEHASNGSSRPKGTRSPYQILQVSPTASPAEVRAAYRRMVQLYHPDKVAGLGPELRQVAEQHMKEINSAYEQLKRRRH